MSLKPPTMWVEQRGRQHRVYWRNAPGLGLPARSYYGRLYSRGDAERFISLAAHVGPDAARRVTDAPDVATRRDLIATALAERDLALADPAPRTAPEVLPAAPAGSPLSTEPTDPRLTGVTFEELWGRFLGRIRHVDEGTHKLYEAYGRNHLLPFFSGTDIGLILRTRPLRAADAPAGALYVDDDWVTGMLRKERRNNAGRPIAGSLLSKKFVDNVLTVLGQCFDLASSNGRRCWRSTGRRRSGCPSTTAGRCSS